MSHGVLPHHVAESTRAGMTPLARRLHAFGVTANVVTVAGFVLTAIGSALLVAERPLAAFAVLLVGTLSDSLDGQLARISGGGTKLGAFLDSTLDRLADAAIAVAAAAIGAARGDWLLFWSALAGLVAAFLVSYMRAKAESLGISAAVGLAPREARIAILLTGVGVWALLGLPQAFVAAVALVALLAVITLLQRLAHVAAALR